MIPHPPKGVLNRTNHIRIGYMTSTHRTTASALLYHIDCCFKVKHSVNSLGHPPLYELAYSSRQHRGKEISSTTSIPSIHSAYRLFFCVQPGLTDTDTKGMPFFVVCFQHHARNLVE